MTAPRPIRPIDGNALILALEDERATKHSTLVQAGISASIDVVRCFPTLPQPEPVEGDAISRKAVIELVSKVWNSKLPYLLSDLVQELHQLPSIPATPTLDVDDGYETCTVQECTHARLASGSIVEVQESAFGKVANLESSSKQILYSFWHELSITPVKRNPKPKEPTLLEAAKLIIQLDVEASTDRARQALSDLHKAIEREESAIERERKEVPE